MKAGKRDVQNTQVSIIISPGMVFITDLSGKDDFHLLYGHMVTQEPRREIIRLEEILGYISLINDIRCATYFFKIRRAAGSISMEVIRFAPCNLESSKRMDSSRYLESICIDSGRVRMPGIRWQGAPYEPSFATGILGEGG